MDNNIENFTLELANLLAKYRLCIGVDVEWPGSQGLPTTFVVYPDSHDTNTQPLSTTTPYFSKHSQFIDADSIRQLFNL